MPRHARPFRQLSPGSKERKSRCKRPRIHPPARGIRAERTFDEPGEAIDFKAHLRLIERRGGLESLDTGSETLEEFLPTYWRLYAKRRLAKSARKKNRGLWNRYLLPRLGALEIRQITPMLLSELVAEWEYEGVEDWSGRALMDSEWR